MAVHVLNQTAFLGDLLLAIPLMKQIKILWPEDSLILVCKKGLGEIFLKTKLVDEVIEITKGDSASYRKAKLLLSQKEIKYFFSPHSSARTHLWSLGIKAHQKIGFKNFYNFLFFEHRISKNLSLPDSLRQMSLLSAFDSDLDSKIKSYAKENSAYLRSPNHKLSPPPAWASMSLREILLKDRTTLSRILEKRNLSASRNKPWIFIFPGSVWATKKWTDKGYQELAKNLQLQGNQVLLMGASDEKNICDKISASANGILNLCGQTSLYESLLLLTQAALVIGNDSASMHLASAAAVPMIAIFGPTVIEFGYRPWASEAFVIENQTLACRPCGPHGHHKCPLGTHECMNSIESQRVFDLATNLLNLRLK